jgi:hypothetical protein
LSEGDDLGRDRVVQKIHALTTVTTSGAQTRAFSPTPAVIPEIVARVVFTNGTEEILRIAVP